MNSRPAGDTYQDAISREEIEKESLANNIFKSCESQDVDKA